MRKGVFIAAAVSLATAGCYSVQWVSGSPDAFLNHANPEFVVVTVQGVPPISVVSPRLVGDTLYGTRPEGGSVAVPWTNVLDVYARQIDGTKTALAVTASTILAGLLVYSFVQEADGSPGPSLCQVPAGSYDHDLDPECSRP